MTTKATAQAAPQSANRARSAKRINRRADMLAAAYLSSVDVSTLPADFDTSGVVCGPQSAFEAKRLEARWMANERAEIEATLLANDLDDAFASIAAPVSLGMVWM